ncbi:unnamed protein product [Lactuca saligna]|uniref:Uncharacterized protein n=1 Tax=Lactuca saligna TaxID=75948 RepID=A0AA35V317_LACSI|nr:unnamed protein product [Lactuca saligna]
MMMRHLAAIGETYAQTALEDAAWNLWHVNPSQASTSTSTSSSNNPNPFTSIVRHQGGHTTRGGGGSLIRTMPTPLVPDVDLSNIIAMVETVREVLPHVPDELILQGQWRWSSETLLLLLGSSAYIWELGLDNKAVEDFDDWINWLMYKGGVGVKGDNSWESWRDEQTHIQKIRGRVLETILCLRFFIFQYEIVYKLQLTGNHTSLLFYSITLPKMSLNSNVASLLLTSRVRNTNTYRKPFSFTVAFKTYILVSDIRRIEDAEIKHKIRKVDPTWDMEADEGDNYTHIPVRNRVG